MLNNTNTHTLCAAPMIDWTDKHCRFFHRLFSKNVMLYTEMITTGAIIHGKAIQYLNYNEEEHPLTLQLGGSDPYELERCAKLAKEYNYDEINLNCGCPSERVQKGAFGACLMKEVTLVAQCFKAMQQSGLPISIKHRIGIDEINDYGFLFDFVNVLYQAGCTTFIVHARNAILKGLTPKENREIPPLKYEYVYRLKQDFPQAKIIINGGLNNVDLAIEQLNIVDGIMLGRSAYHTPIIINQLAQKIWGEPPVNLDKIQDSMCEYAIKQVEQGIYLGCITRHMLGLFHGEKNSRLWRQHLSNHKYLKQAKTAEQIFNFFQQSKNILAL